jgi:NADPH-dependent glutamate synthase beta subunit-like oxidoreductase
MSIDKIDLNLCNGCSICVDTCPCDVIRLDTEVKIQEEHAPCRFACPGGVNMRRYNYLVQAGMLDEAVEVVSQVLPLAAITGRVCPHPCESDCARREVDESVNINCLERFVGDYWLSQKARPPKILFTSKVAVVGSGPAGLSAAYFICRLGYPVTIFEAMPKLGGMLRAGIAEYSLPREVLDTQINYLKDMGIKMMPNITFGQDIKLTDLKKEGYNAVFLAIGNQLSASMDVKGVQLDGVLGALDFLKGVNLKRVVKVGQTVLVIGGGDVAMEAALAAKRLGAKEVKIACLESNSEMPAHPESIKQAIDEGIEIKASWGLGRITGRQSRVNGAELVRCLSVLDKTGAFNPHLDKKTTELISAETLILAIGQNTDFSLIPPEIKTRGNVFVVDPLTLETSLPGVFAGGDAVTSGAKNVISAITSARQAAVSIDRYLKSEDLRAGREGMSIKVKNVPQAGIQLRPRQSAPELPVNKRINNFREIKSGFNEDQAIIEARRCMTCGSRAVITYAEDCMVCEACAHKCPRNAIYVSPQKQAPLLVSWG